MKIQDAKNRHLGTIVQLCRAVSSQLRHESTIGKIVKQHYILHMSPQYGKLRPSSGWDHFVSLGHPCNFQRVSPLGSVTARHSSIGRQANFAALNRGVESDLYLAGRPSRWALAHISSYISSSIVNASAYRRLSAWVNQRVATFVPLSQNGLLLVKLRVWLCVTVIRHLLHSACSHIFSNEFEFYF